MAGALAVLAFRCATGRTPFAAEDVTALLRQRGSNHVGLRQFNERVVLQALRTPFAVASTELDASGCHTLLLSSEFFFPAIADIQKAFPEAEFVVYVRNPIELLESNYNQSVKRHDETKAFVAPAASIRLKPAIWPRLQSKPVTPSVSFVSMPSVCRPSSRAM